MNNLDINEQSILKILKNKNICSIQDLRYLLLFYESQGKTNEEILSEIENFQWKFEISNVDHKSLIHLIMKKGKSDCFGRERFENVTLYQTEVEHLETVCDDVVRKVLYLALIYSKWDNHSSGWIHYNREKLFLFWGLKLSEREKNVIMRRCSEQGMMLKVVGSKNPIVCFKLDFRVEEGVPAKILVDVDDIKAGYQELFECEEE